MKRQHQSLILSGAGGGGGGGASALATAILALSPVGYWKFDETEGTDVIDYSTNANNGTYTTAYTLGGIAGGDGNNYTLWNSPFVGGTIPHLAAYAHEATGLSFFLLVQTNSGQTREMWMNKGSGSSSSSAWQIRRFTFRPQIGTLTSANPPLDGARDITSGTEMTINQWMSFTGSFGSNTNADIHKIDGATVATGASSGTGSTGTTGPIQIAGNEDDNSNQGLVGGLAHFALFSGVLSDGDLTGLHTAAATDGWI